MLLLDGLARELRSERGRYFGKIRSVRGPVITASLPAAAVGDVCRVAAGTGRSVLARVVAFNNDCVTLVPFDELNGVSPSATVENLRTHPVITFSESMLGSVLDSCGQKIARPDCPGSGSPAGLTHELPLFRQPPCPLSRAPVRKIMATGVKSIDTLCTLGYGQRIGLFAGAGAGKSTLLGMIARNADVDVNVIALVGERGREVNDFIREALGDEGLKKSVLVVTTSDEPPLRRSIAAAAATSIAEFYRDRGKRVLLLVDSLTRTARALRDVSLAAGEIPVRQGLTPAVYSELPRLIERAGNSDKGSITAIYTMLDTIEYELDPLAEEVKSLLDGHIVLSGEIAALGVRPAIDFTRSLSRLRGRLLDKEALLRGDQVIKIIARLKKDRDLIALGGTADPELAACIAAEPAIRSFLSQDTEDRFAVEESLGELAGIPAV